MTESRLADDIHRSKALLKALGVKETPEHLSAVQSVLTGIRTDQRIIDVQLCNKIAADVDGSLGEGRSDLAELARQCAPAIETGDPGACDEVQSRG